MPRGRRKKTPPEDEIFGGTLDPDDAGDVPAMPLGDEPEDPPPELLALGMPPEDAAGIQKWNYRLITTMIALAVKDPKISNETRAKRIAQLSVAAAKHYPEASRFDLAQRLDREAEEMAGKKRARAAAKMERRPPAGGAKVIPLRPDAPQG
ncbi:MAG TPA: hypothetical protein VFZ00_11155 [Solirubrobacter sp.]|nr:hypothetical protein [Solirubrobacter sp.]